MNLLLKNVIIYKENLKKEGISMINKILTSFKNLDNIVKKIMKYGIEFSFIGALASVTLLFSYILFFHSPTLYYIGIYSLKLTITIAIEFIICGFACDTIKKQLI